MNRGMRQRGRPINALAIIKKELSSLDKVKRVVKVVGYVASDPNFYDQPKVINGASELFVEVSVIYGASRPVPR